VRAFFSAHSVSGHGHRIQPVTPNLCIYCAVGDMGFGGQLCSCALDYDVCGSCIKEFDNPEEEEELFRQKEELIALLKKEESKI
jgi:hypothetical protein